MISTSPRTLSSLRRYAITPNLELRSRLSGASLRRGAMPLDFIEARASRVGPPPSTRASRGSARPSGMRECRPQRNLRPAHARNTILGKPSICRESGPPQSLVRRPGRPASCARGAQPSRSHPRARGYPNRLCPTGPADSHSGSPRGSGLTWWRVT